MMDRGSAATLEQIPRDLATLRQFWGEIRPGSRDVTALKRLHRHVQMCVIEAELIDLDSLQDQIRAIGKEVKGLLLEPGPISPERHEKITDRVEALQEVQITPPPPAAPAPRDPTIRTTRPKMARAPEVAAPVPVAPPAPAAPTAADAVLREVKRVFLVEKDGTLASVLPLAIGPHDYEVVSFRFPEEMLEALDDSRPAAIIMDVVVPEDPGSGAASVLRLREVFQSGIPILFISARRDLATRLELVRSGGDVYFVSSVDIDGMIQKLEILAREPDDPFRALILTDDFGGALRYSLNLENLGMVTEGISDPAECLPVLREFKPDVVLIDLTDSSVTALEMAEVIGQDDQCQTLPVLIACPEGQDVAGRRNFVRRDIDEETLAQIVQSRARRHRILDAGAPTRKVLSSSESGSGFGAEDAMELVRQTKRLEQIQFELTRAREQQRAMLPETPVVEGYAFRALYEPCEEISGDFYDFIDLGAGKTGVVIADVTGHGVTAALTMSMCKKVIHLISRQSDSPAETLILANREVLSEVDQTTFVTLVYGILDSERHTFRFARAGHEPLVLFNPARDEQISLHQPRGIALGLQSGKLFETTIEETEISLVEGDLILLYTDGLVEATNDSGDEFGREGLLSVFPTRPKWVPDSLVEHLYGVATRFAANRQIGDDLTLLALRYR